MSKIVLLLTISLFVTSCSAIKLIEQRPDSTPSFTQDIKLSQAAPKRITEKKVKKTPSRTTASIKKHKKYKKKPRKKGGKDYRTDLKLKYSKNLFNFWIKYFTKREKARFNRHLRNGDRYRETVTKIMKRHGLPADLFFVGLIESGFNTKIRSRASAVGPWQFIKGTAKRYGLKVNSKMDERRNIHKATEAAARYFKDLYNIFGSWELALCAYNAGEYKIINSIRRGNSRDYRELVRKKLLPKETIYYIPKVAAAMELFHNRSKYKLKFHKSSVTEGRLYKHARSVKVRSGFSLLSVARKHKVSHSSLKKLNPDYKKNWIKVSKRRPITVYLPGSKTSSRKNVYIVKRGDSLSRIASKFGTTVTMLTKHNSLKSKVIFPRQKLYIPN